MLVLDTKVLMIAVVGLVVLPFALVILTICFLWSVVVEGTPALLWMLFYSWLVERKPKRKLRTV